MGGTAIWRAADMIIEKGTRIAAEVLEAAEADIRFADGDFVVAGTDRRIALLEVARIAPEAGTPLDTYHAWTREWMTFPNGTHVAEVEIDRETGAVRLVRYSAVDDYGVLVNPMVAAGQAHGAIAQGAGQALLEQTAIRQRIGSAHRRLVHGLRDAARRRSAAVRARNSTRRAARPTRWASRAAARPARSPPSRRSATRSSTRWRRSAVADFAGPATPERIWRALLGRDK